MLTKNQLKYLKTNAHDLKVVVIIGSRGITEEVISEINKSIDHHELMKIKINGLNKENKEEISKEISQKTNTQVVQILGSIVTLFKQKKNREESKFVLPKD